MPEFIVDRKKTIDLHNAIQELFFEHCEDFETFPEDDYSEQRAHCKRCPYFKACELSNEITFRLATGRW